MDSDLRIVFMGTPEFAVASLDILVKNNYNIVGVITAPDKPAGRGKQLKESAIKKYALAHQLPLLQPEKLKNPEFIAELKALNADCQIVVAFRMLTDIVWSMPPLGTFNLHGSLLPQYRGAAPINWAIINGEKESGVTTFFLNEEIDMGKIIFRAKEIIYEDDTTGTLYERLMKDGADLTLKTVRAIESGNYTPQEQGDFIKMGEKPKPAPKIFKEDCKIDWKKNTEELYNFIRGLAPYPTAWTELIREQEVISLKIFKSKKEIVKHNFSVASIHSDGKTYAKIASKDGFIHLQEIQLAGKRKMEIEEFIRGFPLSQSCIKQ